MRLCKRVLGALEEWEDDCMDSNLSIPDPFFFLFFFFLFHCLTLLKTYGNSSSTILSDHHYAKESRVWTARTVGFRICGEAIKRAKSLKDFFLAREEDKLVA